MTVKFEEEYPSLESYWRSIILFGQNVASYKFALGKSLLSFAEEGKEFISLEELSKPFSENIVSHLKSGKRQTTSRTSKFLDACQDFSNGKLTEDELIGKTVRLGFVNVIDAFHVVNKKELPIRFFMDERKGAIKGIRLTDDVFSLHESVQIENLPDEIEARWNLVETAWDMNISRNIITVSYDDDDKMLFTKDLKKRRVSITSCRKSLNGYQKGKCFYCFSDISIIEGASNLGDVDHFFPHTLTYNDFQNINGVWNLVLACKNCNRGQLGKFAWIPKFRFLERLHKRNEYLIGSHHPLRETLMAQTGKNEQIRGAFLNKYYNDAKGVLIHDWGPTDEREPVF